MTMTIDPVAEAKRAKAEALEAQKKDYFDLLHRYVDGDTINGARLLELAESIGRDVDKDKAIVQKERRLQAEARKKEANSAECAALDAEARKIKGERDAVTADFDSRLRPIIAELNRLRTIVRDAGLAEAELQRIRQEHWQVFGVEDPAIAANKRHLVHAILPCEHKRKYEAHAIESFMHLGHGGTVVNMGFDSSQFQIVPDEGQSAEEFDAVKRIERTLRDDGTAARYVYLSKADYPSPTRYRNVVIAPDDMQSLPAGRWHPVCPPRYPREKFEKALATIKRRLSPERAEEVLGEPE